MISRRSFIVGVGASVAVKAIDSLIGSPTLMGKHSKNKMLLIIDEATESPVANQFMIVRKDFKTPEYCVSAIQSTAEFERVFAQIVENLKAISVAREGI